MVINNVCCAGEEKRKVGIYRSEGSRKGAYIEWINGGIQWKGQDDVCDVTPLFLLVIFFEIDLWPRDHDQTMKYV